MGKLSQTDKHDPYVHTGQPNPEQIEPQSSTPGQQSITDPKKKTVQNQGKEQGEQKKTGTQ
jgi:hypothetical protein